VLDHVITIRNPFGSNSFLEREVIQFGIAGITNPTSVYDVGTFIVETYEVFDGERYLVDSSESQGLYSPTPGRI
jgi:hypothetical protein